MKPLAILRAAQFFHMYLYALVTGVFWGTWFSLSRSIAAITPGTFLEVGHTMIQNLGRPMSVLIPATIVSNVVMLVLLYRHKQLTAFVLEAVALVVLLFALVVTLTVNVPIDDLIRQWTVQTLPPDWEAIRDRWEFYHGLRTLGSLVGLGCTFAGVLYAPSSARESMRSSR
jgi:uncharacterized membrane protein